MGRRVLRLMTHYRLNIIVDQQWFDMLGQLSKHQEGFMWGDVKSFEWGEEDE